jgi:telomere length regulation protein
MKYLRADDYEKIRIALKTGPNLIRHKATFGTELSSQAQDIARILVGMQDTFEMDDFQKMRHDVLIALIASAPDISPYLIEMYFSGDLSIQQRCILLSALGIGTRELAGLEKIVITFSFGIDFRKPQQCNYFLP